MKIDKPIIDVRRDIVRVGWCSVGENLDLVAEPGHMGKCLRFHNYETGFKTQLFKNVIESLDAWNDHQKTHDVLNWE